MPKGQTYKRNKHKRRKTSEPTTYHRKKQSQIRDAEIAYLEQVIAQYERQHGISTRI